MQILESSLLGLRTARMVFRSPDLPVSFTLYPMVHVGDRAFYETVYAEAFEHDVALVEGVKSPVARRLSRAYRWLNFARLGMVLQPRCPAPETVSARIVLADLGTEDFHREWRKIPLHIRAGLAVGAFLGGIYLRMFASRALIARHNSLEDRRSSGEIMRWRPWMEPVMHSIVHARDARLVECIAAELDQIEAEPKRVAIVYGAGHMRAVIRELSRRGFYCADSSWLTVNAH